VSYRLGLQGVADLIEFHPIIGNTANGMALPERKGFFMPQPVEYKRGKAKPDDRDAVQLCAQALCLEEMYDISIDRGYIFYGQTRRRTEILFDQQLRTRVEELSKQMHEYFRVGLTPPARKGVNCNLCSMVDVCLPKIWHKTRTVKEYLDQQLNTLKNSDN